MIVERLNTSSDLYAVADLYAKVFAGPPWNEVSKCPQCQNFSAQESGQPCPCGNGILSIAYPQKETAEYIAQELSEPQAIGRLGRDNETNIPIVFGWAFSLNGLGFAETKYKKPDSKEIIARVVGNTDYFYISEVGVNPQFQGKKLGTRITKLLAAHQGNKPLLMRTNQDSPMKHIALNLGMQPILGLDTGIFDPENPSRVIFTKQKIIGRYE